MLAGTRGTIDESGNAWGTGAGSAGIFVSSRVLVYESDPDEIDTLNVNYGSHA